MKTLITLFTLSLFASPLVASAHEENMDACAPVFSACEAAGFTKDETAAAGKKIWADCASPLMDGKKVAGVDVSAKTGAKCKKFKADKDAFVKTWNEKHKND